MFLQLTRSSVLFPIYKIIVYNCHDYTEYIVKKVTKIL